MYLAISSRPSTRSTTERLKAAGALLAQMAVADISGEEGSGDQVADRAAVARHRSRWSPRCCSGGGGALSGPRICSQGSVGLHRAEMSGTDHSTASMKKQVSAVGLFRFTVCIGVAPLCTRASLTAAPD